MKYLTTILLCIGVSSSGRAQCYSSSCCPQSSIQILSPPSYCGCNGNGVSQCGDPISVGCGSVNSFCNFGPGDCGSSCSQPAPCCLAPIISVPQPISPCCSGQNIQPITSCCSAQNIQPFSSCCSGQNIQPITTCCSGTAIQPAGSCCCGPIIQPISQCCSVPAVSNNPCCSVPSVPIGTSCDGSCGLLNSPNFAAALYQAIFGFPFSNNILQCNGPSGYQCGSNCGGLINYLYGNQCGAAPSCGCGCISPYYYSALYQLVLGSPYLRNLLQCNCLGGIQLGPECGYPGPDSCPSDVCGKPIPSCSPCNTCCNFQCSGVPFYDASSCGFQQPTICPYKNCPRGRPGLIKKEQYTDAVKISEPESFSLKASDRTEERKPQRYTISGISKSKISENTTPQRSRFDRNVECNQYSI